MPESTRKTVIAVDGTAASGKSTFAKMLSASLGYAYLDTGALYRMVALATLQRGGDPSSIEDVRPALSLIKYPLAPAVLTSADLRTPEVDEAVPQVSVMPEVRAVIRQYQNAFMKNPPGNAAGTVLDGRDIGTVICPDAEVKFFVTASAEVRARRRFEQQKSDNPGLTQEMVLKDINLRDKHDNIVSAADAHLIDTSSATPDATLQKGLAIVKAKLAAKPRPAAAATPKSLHPAI